GDIEFGIIDREIIYTKLVTEIINCCFQLVPPNPCSLPQQVFNHNLEPPALESRRKRVQVRSLDCQSELLLQKAGNLKHRRREIVYIHRFEKLDALGFRQLLKLLISNLVRSADRFLRY